MRERRIELQNIERKILQKEEMIDNKIQQLEKQEKLIQIKEKENLEKEQELNKHLEKHKQELERISGLTREEAKTTVA